MNAVEFTTELRGSVLQIPAEAAAQLPKTGKVRVILLTEDSEDAEWRAASYQQFLREDPPEDSAYDALR
jgi:hypothetical protein